jgi:hypothetical protein
VNRHHHLVLAWLAGLGLAACGPTIGDACASDRDCGAGVCLLKDSTPGGACSLACAVGGPPCPAGTLCVKDAITKGQPGCMRSCKRQADCRDEYVCTLVKGSETPVCVGPAGL